MYRKIIAAAILLAMLAGCGKGDTEGSTVTSAEVTAAEISETVTESTTAASEVTTTTVPAASETTTAAVTEKAEAPRIYPAEELYSAYPVKIIYHERQDVSDKVKTEVLREDICNSEGLLISKFFAEYPVISGYDEAVCKKINGEIYGYICGVLEDEKELAEEYSAKVRDIEYSRENGLPAKRIVNVEGTDFDGFGYDINGNIFSVYFADSYRGMFNLHGSENPSPMMFDLRTGDKIVFSELVGDKDKMQAAFAKTERRGELLHGTIPFGERDADEMQDIFALGLREDDILFKDDRIIAVDGCIGFILAPYEAGSFADGVRLWRLPASEFIPYMNDKGKALFEGYVSAETEPPKVIEYKGRRWFDVTEWIPDIIDRENLTEYDREFISMFESARAYDKERCGITTGEE